MRVRGHPARVASRRELECPEESACFGVSASLRGHPRKSPFGGRVGGTMGDHGILESVGLAREQLTALRAALEKEGATAGSRGITGALRDLQGHLDVLQTRYGLLRDILDRTSDIVFAKDRDGRYTMINPQGAEVLGKTMAEVLGSDDRALFEPADAERLMAVDREVVRTGVSQTHEVSFASRGGTSTLLTTTTAWYDRERSVRGVIGVAQDVTERKRRERTAATTQERMRSMAAEIVISE